MFIVLSHEPMAYKVECCAFAFTCQRALRPAVKCFCVAVRTVFGQRFLSVHGSDLFSAVIHQNWIITNQMRSVR
jgi:hypothetical protein